MNVRRSGTTQSSTSSDRSGGNSQSEWRDAQLNTDDFVKAMAFAIKRFPHWFASFRADRLQPERFAEHRVIVEHLRK